MELPLGLGMALAQNESAMHNFSAMSQREQEAVIKKAHNVHSKREMQQLVDGLNSAQG